MDSRASDIINRQQKLRGDRANWDSLYQEVADRCWPSMSDFVTQRSPGEKRTQHIFDATAVLALDRASAAFHSLMVPDHQMWHGLKLGGDKSLSEYQPVKAWLEDVRDTLFAVRRSPKANFSSQAQECLRTLLGFGTQCMFVDEVPGGGKDGNVGIRYKSIHLSELDFAENAHGLVDCVYRSFDLTARQAVELFGLDNMPEKIKDCYEKKDEQKKFQFIHCVMPNQEYNRNRLGWEGMRFYSAYVSVEGGVMIEEGGYRRFPYLVSRYSTNPKEIRGRGPAILLLPDIKTLNQQEKTRLRAGQLAVDPPLLAYAQGSLEVFQMRPAAVNYGALDEQGRQLVQPLQTGANLPWATELLEERRRLINEGFWLTLFQILVQNPAMTATEAMLRAQEKGQLMAAPIGRQEAEWFGPLIRRELDILAENDMLPIPPDEIVDLLPFKQRGDVLEYDIAEDLEIEYSSPIARLVRAEDGMAIMRTMEQLGPLAQVDPSVYDVFDFDALPRELANINGVPAKVMNSPEKLAQIKESKRMQAEQAAMLQAAPVAADAAKNLAQAAQTAQGLPV